jgi:hypothetical protein
MGEHLDEWLLSVSRGVTESEESNGTRPTA